MSGKFPILVTSHSEKFLHIWDLHSVFSGSFNPIHVVQSPLKFETSIISAFGDGQGYAIGSIEGRCGIVNVDLKDPTKVNSKDFCFKCHRKENK